jgi:hypothetical protein
MEALQQTAAHVVAALDIHLAQPRQQLRGGRRWAGARMRAGVCATNQGTPPPG